MLRRNVKVYCTSLKTLTCTINEKKSIYGYYAQYLIKGGMNFHEKCSKSSHTKVKFTCRSLSFWNNDLNPPYLSTKSNKFNKAFHSPKAKQSLHHHVKASNSFKIVTFNDMMEWCQNKWHPWQYFKPSNFIVFWFSLSEFHYSCNKPVDMFIILRLKIFNLSEKGLLCIFFCIICIISIFFYNFVSIFLWNDCEQFHSHKFCKLHKPSK